MAEVPPSDISYLADLFNIWEDNLQCAICIGPYKYPVALNCLHSFCKSCIELMMKTLNSRKIPCPTCRKPTYIYNKSHGADQLARNWYIEDIYDKIRKIQAHLAQLTNDNLDQASREGADTERFAACSDHSRSCAPYGTMCTLCVLEMTCYLQKAATHTLIFDANKKQYQPLLPYIIEKTPSMLKMVEMVDKNCDRPRIPPMMMAVPVGSPKRAGNKAKGSQGSNKRGIVTMLNLPQPRSREGPSSSRRGGAEGPGLKEPKSKEETRGVAKPNKLGHAKRVPAPTHQRPPMTDLTSPMFSILANGASGDHSCLPTNAQNPRMMQTPNSQNLKCPFRRTVERKEQDVVPERQASGWHLVANAPSELIQAVNTTGTKASFNEELTNGSVDMPTVSSSGDPARPQLDKETSLHSAEEQTNPNMNRENIREISIKRVADVLPGDERSSTSTMPQTINFNFLSVPKNIQFPDGLMLEKSLPTMRYNQEIWCNVPQPSLRPKEHPSHEQEQNDEGDQLAESSTQQSERMRPAPYFYAIHQTPEASSELTTEERVKSCLGVACSCKEVTKQFAAEESVKPLSPEELGTRPKTTKFPLKQRASKVRETRPDDNADSENLPLERQEKSAGWLWKVLGLADKKAKGEKQQNK